MLTVARRALLLVCLPGLCLALALGECVTMLAHGLLGEKWSMRITARLVEGAILVLRFVTATKVSVHGRVPQAPAQRPFVVVANHQPPFDMILLAFVFREHLPAFVTREGMHWFIPLVSRYLRITGSIPINLSGSMREVPRRIRLLAERARARRSGVAIFPEGFTPWGQCSEPRPFRRAGLRRLLRAMPDALVVPVVFDGGDRLARPRAWLDLAGTEVNLTILPALEPGGRTVDALIDACELLIHREQLRLIEQRERAPERTYEPGIILASSAGELPQHEIGAPWT